MEVGISPGTTEAPVTSNQAPTGWLRVSCAALLVVAACCADGYRAYVGNHALQIPLVQQIADPTLFPNDPFAASLPTYSAPIWWLIAWLAQLVPLPSLLLALFVIERALLVWAAGALGRVLRPGSILAPWASAAAVAVGVPALLGSSGPIAPPYFEQTGASIPFFLLAFALLIERRRWQWALSLAAGCTLNPMYGVYAATYSALGLAVADRSAWRRWVAPALVATLLSLPALLFAARSASAAPVDDGLWLSAAVTRFASHLAPLQWSATRYLGFGALIIVVALLARRQVHDASPAQADRFAFAATLCALCWLALAFAALHVLRSPRLLILHPARGTDLWYFSAAVYVAAWTAMAAERASSQQRPAWLAALLLSLFLVRALVSVQFAAVAGAALLMLLPWLRRWLASATPRRVAVGVSVVVACFALVRLAVVPSGGGSGSDAGPSEGEQALAAWARRETAADALFLVPPEMAMFRALSRRPVVGTWKDGSAILWHRPHVTEWVDRMHSLGRLAAPAYVSRYPLAPAVYPNVQVWSDTRIADVGRRYRAQFAVLPAERATSLPVVHASSAGYKVVAIADRHAATEGAVRWKLTSE